MPDLILLLDIGTTTISAEIIDSETAKPMAHGVILNSQHEIGEDIVSRMDFAIKSRQNILILQKKAANSVNILIKRLLQEGSIARKDINKVFCACNSAMHHILLGLDILPLITPPYRINQKSEITVFADMVGFKIRKDLKVTFLPNIGGFVGSDALCSILASGIYKSKDLRAVIDMGTNGEVILGNRRRISAASTAAGPAFEARHIKNGMPAIKGAIAGVRVKNNHVKLDIIDSTQPKGITGSGLIDACSQLYQSGFIDRSGRMQAEEFILYKKGKKKIAVTQSDIRKVQLAKGAVLAAMKVLLRRYKADSSDIKQIMLTGSFGTRLNIKSVIGIGLIPKVDIKRVKYIKNAVLTGLRLWVKDKSIREHIFSILGTIEHVPLFGKAFGKEFAASLHF
ncbi:MAG: DUF4445 domain-containing protein [Dehalococcoidia bacterium]|nr:MAG: DUF4445 domain-containing protein [Dehalococcoidia bacterium]